MGSEVDWDTWLRAMTEAVGEIATTSLGYEDYSVVERAHPAAAQAPSSEPLQGAVISLSVHEEILDLALFADGAGCRQLAQAFLGMGPDEELADPDVEDSLRELVNILAGGVKRRLPELSANLWLGLPASVHAAGETGKKPAAAQVHVRMGPVPVQIKLMHTFAPELVAH